MKNLSTSAQQKRKHRINRTNPRSRYRIRRPNRRGERRRTGGERLDHAGAAGFVVAEDLVRGARGVGRRPGAPAVHRARGAWAMAAARVPARGRAAARRASGPAVVVVEGAGGGGDEEELEEGEEWVYICSQRISWAFRGGFGPGLFDPCVGARRRAKAAAAVLVVLCPFTASRPGPL